jgi:peptidyl-prolyl cis-trans isomerase SurA
MPLPARRSSSAKAAACLALLLPLVLRAQPRSQYVDGVIANVAGHIILYSELAGAIEQGRRQGEAPDDATACGHLEDLLYQRLLKEQARIDSVVADPQQVEAELERRLKYFEQQIGGREELEKFYGKPVEAIKAEFREQVSDQLVTQQMQSKISESRRVTPKEVERFYRRIPRDSLPFINAGVEFGRIVKYAKPSAEEDRAVKKFVEDLRGRITAGKIDIGTAASLYSEDPGSAAKDGELPLVPQGVMVPEFDAVALSLKEGEVSQVFRTEFGYHIMTLVERRGDQYRARHILRKPKVRPEDLAAARAYVDSVARMVREGAISFARAATELNDDEDTKGTNGVVIEPDNNTPRWAVGELDQQTAFVLDKLKPGELSAAQAFESPSGDKGFRVLMLQKRTEPHVMDLVEDYPLVSQAAETEVRQRSVSDWVAEKLKNTYVRIIPDYAGCRFQNAWMQPAAE